MQVLCEPGDIVLVDRPSYFVYLEMLAGLGVRAKSIPTGPDGRLDPEGLRALLRAAKADGEAARFKAVYFVSYFSNPSARSLSADEKSALGAILADEGFLLPAIEDAAYRELYYREPAPAPGVLSMSAWARFPRLYLSTLTKPFASGLKVGYGVCTDPDWRARMLHVKGHQDFGSANFNQALCEHVLANGEFDAQLARIRPAYEAKMQALNAAFEREGLRKLGWSWEVPGGGLYLWLRGPEGLDTGMESAFCHRCIAAGVLYVPGELCFGDEPPRNFVRTSFGVLAAPELAEAARRFASVARDAV
jgi:2-aminoadipate transaminase